MKNILLQVQDEPRWQAALEDALTVARAAEAHLDVVVVVPYGIGLAFDSFGGVYVLDELVQENQQRSIDIQDKIADKLKREGLSSTVDLLDGSREVIVFDRAPLHDLIIVNRQSHVLAREPKSVQYLGAILHGTRAPIMICADGERAIDPCGTALVAWNGSAEAAFAIRQAMPLLKMAEKVVVLRVEEPPREDRRQPDFPDIEVMNYLSRHGIHGELEVQTFVDADPRNVIVARAEALDAYVVMGGYGRSRLGELLFGGTTRKMLKACSVPVILAH